MYFSTNFFKNDDMKHKLLSLLAVLVFFTAFTQAQIPEGYYDNATGLTGEALKAALNDIISGHTAYPYTASTTDTWDILKEADRDPNNPENVITIYANSSVNAAQEYNSGNGWEREHVWAKSHGDFDTDPPAGTDCHHLKPALRGPNASRSNKDFDNGGDPVSSAPECNSTATTWEPRDAVKGDVARMMFYMAVRYEGENGEPDLELVDYVTGDTSDPIFGVLSTLLQWHEQDPVDDFETNRNNIVYGFQGNRNPFIDHPEYVSAIWETSAVNENKLANSQIYPNPAKNTIKISGNAEINQLTIYNVIGKKVFESTTRSNTIDISFLSKGQYIVQMQNNSEKVALLLIKL